MSNNWLKQKTENSQKIDADFLSTKQPDANSVEVFMDKYGLYDWFVKESKSDPAYPWMVCVSKRGERDGGSWTGTCHFASKQDAEDYIQMIEDKKELIHHLKIGKISLEWLYAFFEKHKIKNR